MMSDRFVLETPAIEKRRVSISGHDGSQDRSKFSSGSFNNENFGDWGSLSFNNSKESAHFPNPNDRIDDPFSEQKDEPKLNGFNLIDRTKSAPKLPASRREIRIGNAHEQTMTIEIGLQDVKDFPISPVSFGSPMPTRVIKRSVSDSGSFSNTDLDAIDDLPIDPSPSFRSIFHGKKEGGASLSFSERRKSFSGLLSPFGERTKPYRNLVLEEDYEEPPPSPQKPKKKVQDQPPIVNFPSDENDEAFEGSMPLSPEPQQPLAVKKRSSSKDRLRKMSGGRTDRTHPEKPAIDEFDSPRRARKTTSRSSSSPSRLRKKSSLSDSYRNTNSSRDNAEPTTPLNQRRTRRLSTNGVRRSRSGKNEVDRETQGTPNEIKHNSSCNNRRAVGRRASMTGNIVNMGEEPPRDRRRKSMDHCRPKERTSRRASMDHYRESPTSSSSSPSLGYNKNYYERPRSKYDSKKSLSNTDMTGSTFMSNESPSPFLASVPFGEDGNELTQGIETSRKSSKSKDQRIESPRRKAGRNRSVLGKERKRSSSRHPQQQEQLQDKTVTVAEILAMVASTHQPGAPSSEIHSKPVSSKSDKSRSKSRGKSRGKSSGSRSPRRDKPSGKNRQRRRKSLSDSLSKFRKGLRVDHQPEKEPLTQDGNPRRSPDKPAMVRNDSATVSCSQSEKSRGKGSETCSPRREKTRGMNRQRRKNSLSSSFSKFRKGISGVGKEGVLE